MGDSSLKRKETGIKDIKRRHEKIHGKRIQDTFGEKCHQEPQHHEGIGRDHKKTYDRMIHDKMIHGNLGENSPSHF